MKQKYTSPSVEFIRLDFEDIITCSGGSCIPEEPGHGHGHGHAWGYDNGHHNGHGKGHNPYDNP